MDGRTSLAHARIGERWVLRTRRPDGSATDVVGWLEQLGADAVVVSRTPGEEVRVDRATILLARRAPAAAGAGDPGRISADELERHALPGWLADHEPLGAWTLRAGDGFTGRANSCLAVGDPGLPTDAAAAAVRTWYADRDLEPRAQVVVDSTPDRDLTGLGWRETYVRTDVLAIRLTELLGSELPDPAVRIEEQLSDAWLAAYDRSRPNDADPAVLRAILGGHPPYALASLGLPDHDGIARGHLSGPWLGLASVWVAPDLRRRGRATAMMRALGHWGARRGARWAYLQVATANTTAVAAYERLGFRRHHSYRYLTPAEREV